MGYSGSATGADTIPTRASTRAVTSHPASTSTASSYTPSCARTTTPGRSGAISSRHSFTSILDSLLLLTLQVLHSALNLLQLPLYRLGLFLQEIKLLFRGYLRAEGCIPESGRGCCIGRIGTLPDTESRASRVGSLLVGPW
jgi:hypothetical protein